MGQHGGAVIEAALAITVFFAMVVGVVDFGRVQFVRSNLQHAVSQSTRFAAIGSSLEDPNAPGTQLAREASIVHLIREISGFGDIDASDVKIAALTPAGAELVGAGGPGDVVTVAATYRVTLLALFINFAFAGGLYEFNCRTSFRNEEFSSAVERAPGAGRPVCEHSASANRRRGRRSPSSSS